MRLACGGRLDPVIDGVANDEGGFTLDHNAYVLPELAGQIADDARVSFERRADGDQPQLAYGLLETPGEAVEHERVIAKLRLAALELRIDAGALGVVAHHAKLVGEVGEADAEREQI